MNVGKSSVRENVLSQYSQFSFECSSTLTVRSSLGLVVYTPPTFDTFDFTGGQGTGNAMWTLVSVQQRFNALLYNLVIKWKDFTVCNTGLSSLGM